MSNSLICEFCSHKVATCIDTFDVAACDGCCKHDNTEAPCTRRIRQPWEKDLEPEEDDE